MVRYIPCASIDMDVAVCFRFACDVWRGAVMLTAHREQAIVQVTVGLGSILTPHRDPDKSREETEADSVAEAAIQFLVPICIYTYVHIHCIIKIYYIRR